MATKIAVVGPYQAYAGPQTGGFDLVPPSAVPQLSPEQFMLQGDQPDYPIESLYGLGATQAAPVPPPTSEPRKARGPTKIAVLPAPEMAASTIAPKGGTPYQPTTAVDQAMEIYRQLNQEDQNLPGIPPTATGNFTLSTANRIANNLLATPSVVGDILSYPGRQAAYAIKGKGIAPLSVFPKPTVEDIASKLRSVTGGTEADARANIQAAEAKRAEQYPLSTQAGDIAGDVATLAMGRGPFVEGLRAREVELGKKIAHGKTFYESWPFLNAAERKLVLNQSPGFNLFKRGLGRAGEAGIEGATLSLLHGGDPVAAGFFSAGAQGALSASTDFLTRKFVKLPGRIATFAINGYILSKLLYAADVALPGTAKDYEADRTSTQKMLWGYGLGLMTAGLSTRARSGFVSSAMPHIADALGSAPRNAMQSILTTYLKGDEVKKQSLKTKIETLYQNIDQYSLPQLRELSDAFASGNGNRFLTTLDRLSKRVGPP